MNFHDPQGHSFLRILHLDYVVQVLLAGGSRVPYRGKKEVPPALTLLYNFLVKQGYGVWYVPFELWGPEGPLVLTAGP